MVGDDFDWPFDGSDDLPDGWAEKIAFDTGRLRLDGSGTYPDFEAIERKCAAFGIACGLGPSESGRTGGPEEPPALWVRGEIAHGLSTITVVEDGPHARFALAAPFERYRHLAGGPYRGMWSAQLAAVECGVTPYERDHWPHLVMDDGAGDAESIAYEVLEVLGVETGLYRAGALDRSMRVGMATDEGVSVSVGACSDEWAVWHGLAGNPREAGPPRQALVRRALTLRVEGAEVPDERRAVELLERLGEAALFEIERASGVGLRLVRTRGASSRRPWRDETEPTPNLPTRLASGYDREPVSLYQYASSARGSGMPLLAFLAFYQVIEFYFLRYSRWGAMQAVRDSLRGLSFDALGDADLARVLDAVSINRKGFFENELGQLKATLRRCVGQEALRSFFEGDEERRRFYSSDKPKRVSPTRVPIGASSADWRGDVARRVYEIRNRIVHAKSQHDDLDPLLPFDPEAALLWHDVELVAFLARETLSASSKPMGGEAGGPP